MGGGSSDVLQGAVGSLHAGPVARGGHATVPSPHVRGSRSHRMGAQRGKCGSTRRATRSVARGMIQLTSY
jgi:hypothetical protein